MIIFNNNEINTVYYEDKKIKNAYYGNNLIFDFNNYSINKEYKEYLLDPLIYDDYIPNSYILSDTGEVKSQTTYKASNFIELPLNSTIYFYEPIGIGYAYHSGALYDENKNFIKGIRANEADGFYHLSGLNMIQTDSNSKYIRVTSGSNGQLPSIYIYTTLLQQ